MKVVFVRNLNEQEWHRTEVRETSSVPLRKALCGEQAKTLSAVESHESWAIVWSRAIDPPGTYCAKCDELSNRLDPNRPYTWTPGETTQPLGDDALMSQVRDIVDRLWGA